MPYAPEIDEEIVDNAPQVIQPPQSAVQNAQQPVYANNVYQGPATFRTFPGYQAAWEQARRDDLQRQEDEVRLNKVLDQSTAVEDQLKAIQQAKQFVQMRKFGSDLQAAIASGLTPEQALVPALARNPGAILGNMNASVSAFRNAGRSMQPQAPLGETKIITDPETGKRIGIAMLRGDGSMQLIQDRSERITPSQRLGGLRTKAQILNDQIKNTPIGQDSAAPSAELKSVIGQIDQIIADEKPAEIPNPVAQPTDKVKVRNKKTNEIRLSPRANAEQLTPNSNWEIVK